MSNFERDVGAVRGASFFRDASSDEVKFQFVSDPASIVGPRAATEQDKINHPQAWAAYQAELEAEEPKARKGRGKVKDEPADDHSEGG